MSVLAELKRFGRLFAVAAGLLFALSFSASAQTADLVAAQNAVEAQLLTDTGTALTLNEATAAQLEAAGIAALEAAMVSASCPGGGDCQPALDILTVIMAVDVSFVEELVMTLLSFSHDPSSIAETVLAADNSDETVSALADAFRAAGLDGEAIITAAAEAVDTPINTAAIQGSSIQPPTNNQFSNANPPTPSGS